MLERLIYCTERPELKEVKERLSRFGFEEDSSIEWALRLRSPSRNRGNYSGGRCDAVACYSPECPSSGEYAPPQEIHANSAFLLSLEGKASSEDRFFLGLVSGHLGTIYRGVVYDPGRGGLWPELGTLAQPKPAKVLIPPKVWEGLEAVRRSGLTNMLERNAVKDLAQEFGFHDTARWVDSHRREYAEGIFKGFETIKKPEENGE